MSGNCNDAKYCCLTCCEERIRVVNEETNAEGSDKTLSFTPIKIMF